MSFDEIIDRRGTHCAKWDKMEPIYGVPADTGIAMWVADMDFRPPQVVQTALQDMLDHGASIPPPTYVWQQLISEQKTDRYLES